MKYFIILLALVAPGAFADSVSNFKIGPLTSHVDWKDWSMSTDAKIMQFGILLDALQTERIHKEDCYYEANPITHRQIGRQPSTEKVVAWAVASSVATHYSFKFIENSNMPTWLQKVTKYANIAYRYDTVYNNHQIGIRIGSRAKAQPNERGICTWQ